MKRGKLFAALLAAAVLMGSPLAGSISEQKASAEDVMEKVRIIRKLFPEK